MSRRHKLGWTLSIALLLVSAALGIFNGLRELDDVLTPFQRWVSTAVLAYGIIGLAAALAMAARHSSSVWLTALWGVLVTFVASTAALAYAGSSATVAGAIWGGLFTALLAAAVVWCARASTRPSSDPSARTVAVVALLITGAPALGGCRQLYRGPPTVGESDGLTTKVVRAKREPDRLIAEDLSVCWVIPEVFAGIQPGAPWRCAWRHVPTGQ